MTNKLLDFLRIGRAANTPPIRTQMRSVLLVLGLMLGSLSVWGAEYELVYTLDCASASTNGTQQKYGVNNTTAMQGNGVKAFLNEAAGSTLISADATVTGSVYWAKGNGGGTIPTNVLKLGKASEGGTISFTIGGTDDITKVEVIGYGWKNTTAVSVNSSDAQTTSTAQSELYTFPYEISATKTIEIAVTSSAFCATQIKLYKTQTGSDPQQPAVFVTPDSWDFKTVHASAAASKVFSVSGSNLTEGDLILTVPDGFSVSPSSIAVNGTLNATNVTVSKNTTTEGDYEGNLSINGGDCTKTVALTMTVDADPAPTGTFELFSGDIEEGDYVIVSTNALSNTANSNRIASQAVTVSDNKIVNPDAAIIWHIAPVSGETSYWTLYNEVAEKYAGGTTTKNQGALLDDVTDYAKWTITEGTNVYEFVNKGREKGTSDSGNKYLRYNSQNNENSRWACYGNGTGTAPTLYKKEDGKPKAPTFSPAAGSYLEAQNVTITETTGADIYYTLDGTDPSDASTPYTGAIAVGSTTTIKAIAIKDSKSSNIASATYTIVTTEHAGTELDPYSVADAVAVIDAIGTKDGVYVSGIVSQIVTAYNSDYGNISYNISDDGTTTAAQLQAYRGKGIDGANFTSEDDVLVGDEVVIKGLLKKYGSTYEFDADNQLVSLNRTKSAAGLAYAETTIEKNIGDAAFTNTLTNPNSLDVTYSSSATGVATVDENGEVTIVSMGTTTIKATFAGNSSYLADEVSYTLSVNDPSLVKVTFDATIDKGESPLNKSNITLSCSNGVLNNESEYRLYKNSTTTFACSAGNIAMIEFIGESGNPASGFEAPTEGDFVTDGNNATWTGNAASVAFIASGAQVRATKIFVSYKEDTRAEAGLAYAETEIEKQVGDAAFVNTLTNLNSVDVTYESSDTDVAEVANDGTVTIKAEGIATITASFAGDETYKAAEVSYTIKVNASAPTSAETKTVVIIAEYDNKLYAMSNAVSNSACAAIEVTKDGEDLVVTSEANKAAVQWFMSKLGVNVKLQVADNEGRYLSSGSSVSLSLVDEETSWTYAEEDGKYLISKAENRVIMYQGSVNTFKHYATSNVDGYARVSELFEVADGATNIKVVEPIVYEFVVDPDEDVAFGTVEQGETVDAKSFDVTLTNIASATITLSDDAAFSIDKTSLDADGTITITPKTENAGNFSAIITLHDVDENAEDKVIDVKMKVAAPKDCDKTDDFSTVSANGNYANRVSTEGWSAVNTAVAVNEEVTYWIINGKTTNVGVITSPEFNYGIKELSFDYYYSFSESNGISFKVEIKQNGSVVKTENITKADATQNTIYSATIEDIDIEGKYQIVITNLCPTGKSNGNADRFAIGNLCWKKYGEPEYETVRSELEIDHHYTVCLPKNITHIKGATFWNLQYKNAGNSEVYLVEETAPEAGKPYVFQATDTKLEVIYGDETAANPVGNGALRGTFTDINEEAFAVLTGNIYLLIDNAIRPRTTGNYLNANRAYIDYDALTPVSSAPQGAPGRRVKSMPMQSQVATGMDELNVSETPVKMMIDGQLFILRGEKMYNANGQLVK